MLHQRKQAPIRQTAERRRDHLRLSQIPRATSVAAAAGPLRPGQSRPFVGRFGDAFRMAIRLEAVEPPTYVATSRPGQINQSFADATEILLTEFFVKARPDGGADLLLFESGHVVPDGVQRNAGGWDADLIPAIQGYLGES